MNFKIFILSIKRNKERQELIFNSLISEGFHKEIIEIFCGIDYKDISNHNLNQLKSIYAIYPPKSVIACASSHILLWRYIAINYSDLDFVIILEDDVYLDKNKFDKYLPDFYNFISDEIFLNLSTAQIMSKNIEKDLFINSHVILATDCYIITPNLAHRLFNYYQQEKITYHIDFHLSFIKHKIPMKLIHFQEKITKEGNYYDSSMINNHKHYFFLKMIHSFSPNIYKDLNTPLFEINNIVVNLYTLFLLIIFILFYVISIYLYPKITDNYFICFILSLIWLIFGFLIYDIL